MESYQWQYQPTPKELDNNKRLIKFLSFVFYLGAAFFVYYSLTVDFIFNKVILGGLALIELCLWHFWLKKNIKLSRTAYAIDDEGIRTTNLETNKTKSYKWNDMESFSTNVYMRTRSTTHHKLGNPRHLYVSTGKKSAGNNSEGVYKFFVLMVTDSQRQKVIDILRTKLTEWKG